MFNNAYKGRRVFVTGHTGFKGSWLTTWLLELGAEVAGYALEAPSKPSAFEVLGLEKRIRHTHGDVRDAARLAEAVREFRPEVVFHLAAQALAQSGTMRSTAQSPPPMTLPARTVAALGPPAKKLLK